MDSTICTDCAALGAELCTACANRIYEAGRPAIILCSHPARYRSRIADADAHRVYLFCGSCCKILSTYDPQLAGSTAPAA